MNAKICKKLRKYAREKTKTKEDATIAYKQLKHEYLGWEKWQRKT